VKDDALELAGGESSEGAPNTAECLKSREDWMPFAALPGGDAADVHGRSFTVHEPQRTFDRISENTEIAYIVAG
jgi:hypothetical protein